MESTAESVPQAESGALWKRAKVSEGLACGSGVNPAARASSPTRLANPCSCSCRRSTRRLSSSASMPKATNGPVAMSPQYPRAATRSPCWGSREKRGR
ncbi:unnamed protein product [Gulo gulo]|uniref:Uncharacterized protein n=1 Tax=Gulo gulo TaxID=48420 RepID=A0A9X9LBX1_GULGU|nr:unnamed protein product [Gulo gulo]